MLPQLDFNFFYVLEKGDEIYKLSLFKSVEKSFLTKEN